MPLTQAALSDGYSFALLVGAGCCLVGAVVDGVLLRAPRGAQPAGELEPA